MTATTKFGLQSLGGLVIGALLGVAGMTLMSRGLLAPHDYLPMLLAFVYVVLAITVSFNPYVRKTARPGERLSQRAVATLLSALALAAPMLIPRTANPVMAYALIVVVYGASAMIMRRLIKGLDELTQRVIADTNQMTLNVLLAGLFLYGAAERLGLIGEGVSIWVLNGVVLCFYFVWMQIAWMRRGLGNPMVPEE